MSEATLTSKGQITLPASVRKTMGLETGARVVFTQLHDGTMVMRSKHRSIVELKGLLKPSPRPRKLAIEDMNIGQP
jgi:antitoxin PrlF